MKKMLSWIVVIFVLVAFWLLFRIKEPAKSPPHAPATVDNQKTEEQRALTGPPLLSPDSNLPPENMGWHVSVHGIVIDDSERPVNGADIWLFRELQGSMVQRLKTKSGQSGTFKIVVDNPGVWNLKARKQKHGFVQRLYSDRPEETGRIIINEDVKDLGPIILRLEKLRTLDVFVTDQATGSPIERASIGFYGMSFDPPRTNSEGHTQIHMPNGKWNLSSWAPGYSYQNNEVDFTKDPIKPLHIPLKPGGLIYGYVTNLDGQPLPGAQIHIKHHSLGRISEVLITDEKGYYEYTSAPLGTPFSLYVYLRGYERFVIRPIKIDPELRSLKWNFTLKPEGAGSPQDQFQFKIEDEKGESIYGATVGAIGFGRHIPKVTELGKGHFRISQMNKGRYSVKINHRNYINLEKRVRAKTSDSQPEIWVMRSGYSITGKVVDQENQPIANASIVFGSIKSGRGDLETDKDGFFKVNGLESEEIYFKVSHELYSKA